MEKPLYRIKDWEENFECAQSRKLVHMTWVPIPNKHDGKSFRRLIRKKNGPALYGVWVLLVQVASKCPKRGILADSDGPLDAEDLAVKIDVSALLVEQALQVLVSPEVAWIVVESTTVVGDSTTRREQKGTEGKGREQKGREQKKKPDKPAPPKLEFPRELDTEACRVAWQRWLDYKKARRESYKTVDSQEAQLKRQAKIGSKRFLAAVEYSIAQNFAGIYEEKTDGRKKEKYGLSGHPGIDYDPNAPG